VAFMAQLDLIIVNVALPTLSKSFSDSGLNDLSWVLNAYAIASAACAAAPVLPGTPDPHEGGVGGAGVGAL